MRQSDEILVCKVQPEWHRIVKDEYISAGSSATNFWSLKQKDSAPDQELARVKPGSLVLQVLKQGGQYYIVGGGYFVKWVLLKPSKAWECFGVRNGRNSFAEMMQEIREQGGDENSDLISHILYGTFIFSNRDALPVPVEYTQEFDDNDYRFLISTAQPIGRYLDHILRERRAGLSAEEYSSDWRGIYYLAAKHVEHADIDGFHAAVMAAYDFKCAITGDTSVPVLDVANIQPCYSKSFQSVQNGVLMRCDLHRLFSEGYITLSYVGDDAIEVRVSKSLASMGAESYLKYDHKRITLPQDRTAWPKREYLLWHNNKCFEHWTWVGGTVA